MIYTTVRKISLKDASFNRFFIVKGGATQEWHGKKTGKGHHPNSPNLNQHEQHDLPGQRKSGTGINDSQPGHTHGTRRGKQGIHETDPLVRGIR